MNALKAANSLVMRLLFIVATLLLSSCCSFSALSNLKTPQAEIIGKLPTIEKGEARDIIRAGAAKMDITPPPGIPMGGHSIIGQISRGHWLRLKARSLYIETPNGSKLALVSTDLWQMPAGLGDRVAEIVGTTAPDKCRLGRDQMVLAATHTHQSPGNFASSQLYNKAGSIKPGFDRTLFEFLAERLAEAVKRSCVGAEAAELNFVNTRVGQLARNRSIKAFLQNDATDVEQILLSASDLEEGELPEIYDQDKRAFHALDPRLQTLWIRTVSKPSRVIGVGAFTAVHTTALNHEAEIYSSDLFGVAAVVAERELKRLTGSAPIVAIFNGAQGDISPNWAHQDRQDVLKLGSHLGAAILETGSNRHKIRVTGDIRANFEYRPLDGQSVQYGDEMLFTPLRAVGGIGAIGGSEDGRTCLFDWPIKCREGCFGELCNIIYDVVKSQQQSHMEPNNVPFGVYKLGPILFATLPGEFTTVVGHRIRKALANQLLTNKERDNVILIGIANEYVSYITTPEEYVLQHYEGGMTLFGKASGPLMRKHLNEVASLLSHGHSKQQLHGFRHNAGNIQAFSPRRLDWVTRDGLKRHIQTVVHDAKRKSPPIIRDNCWHGVAPSVAEVRQKSWQPTPSVEVEEKLADGSWQPLIVNGVVENDEGLNLIVQLSAWRGSNSEWCAFWLPPEGMEHRDALRFRVTGHDGLLYFLPLD